MNSLFGERLMWKGVGHMVRNEWMIRRREDHADQRVEAGGRHTTAGEMWFCKMTRWEKGPL
jgi:hypothetical protein